MPDPVLVIEDESLLREELARHFRREGWEVTLAATLAEAEALLRGRGIAPLVVLSDMTLPDGNALDLLERLRRDGGRVAGEWIFLTGYGTIPDSVRALRLGAFEFLEKPCPIERLDLVVAGAARSARAQRRLRELADAEHRRYAPAAFVGSSPRAREVRDLLGRLCQVPFSALVLGGETGTGKGLAARILHYSGPHGDAPLVEINCAALPRELLESELFGHEAGSFTGARGRHRGYIEQARGGTLLLDEIGEMDLGLQAKLLKAIEDRHVRRVGGEHEIAVEVQIIAASNRDLLAEVKAGRFREDLYHRLGVLRIDLPPLRERIEDLEELVPLILAEYNLAAGKKVRIVPDRVWERLRAWRWPGNVRELRNVIERCVLLAEGEALPEQWLQLPDETGSAPSGPAPPAASAAPVAPIAPVPPADAADAVQVPLDGSMSLDDIEKHVIRVALERHGHNVTAAARALGTTRQTLRYRIQKYGL